MMPEIKHCDVRECFYNKDGRCHAEAITVGSLSPKCDTFFKTDQHGGPATQGHVGACHVSDCHWNKQLSCTAEGIEISLHGQEPDCDTFRNK